MRSCFRKLVLIHSKNVECSRKISKQLHSFAQKAREILYQHNGQAIYTGGDDILALVPLFNAFHCAKTLAETFKEQMKSLAEALLALHPTLSVGRAIGHFVQPMRRLRQSASQAEALAKGSDKPAAQ